VEAAVIVVEVECSVCRRSGWELKVVAASAALLCLALAAGLLGWEVYAWLALGSLVLSMLVLLPGGIREVREGVFSVGLLAALASVSAVALGYYGEGAAVALLYVVAEWLEAYAYGRAEASVMELAEEAPRVARVLRGGGAEAVRVEDVRVGEVVLVKPGEVAPLDGVVVEGYTAVGEALLTGEAC